MTVGHVRAKVKGKGEAKIKDRQKSRTGEKRAFRQRFLAAKAPLPQPAAGIPKRRHRPQRADYSFREPGSERFFGDFLLRTATNSCPAGGTATTPLRMISSAESFLP